MNKYTLLTIIFLASYSTSTFASSQESMEFVGAYEANTNETAGIVTCEKEIQMLIGRVETLEHAVAELKRHGAPNMSQLHNDAAKHDTTETAETLDAGPIKPMEPKSEKQHYDLALVALKDNNLDHAEKKFAEFIEKYPKSTMLGNAYFWYGEVFFKRNNFEKAAINYLKCYKQFPKGAKAPDALLKLALSLGEMKKIKEACAMLTKLDQEFKDRAASSIKRTKDARNKYGCR
jgi:tol-pal system protein YbgF